MESADRRIDPETLLAGMRLGLRMGAEMVRDAPGWNAAQIAAEMEAEAEALSAPLHRRSRPMPPADPAAPQVPEPDGMLAYAMAIQNPSRDDPTWPLPSFDARDWAESFCAIAKKQGHDIDEGWMVAWFANALMRGFDEARMRQAKEVPHA